MANGYSQIFTLTDIFNNKKLKNKIPLINYREKELENGKISRRTYGKTVNRQVFDTATSAARPFYKPIKTQRNKDIMIISGDLVGDHDEAVEAVYNSLQAKRSILIWTANNADMIRTALKEAEEHKRTLGNDCKLYLRAKSMQQIEGMSNREIEALMQNVMENIMFGDDFPKTQEKYKVESMKLSTKFDYKQLKLMWKFRVGDV